MRGSGGKLESPGMCGFVGIVDLGGGVEAEALRRMRDTLAHRGPDDAGLWVREDGTVGLGHRRLSILDLSPQGHQPMGDPDGRVQLVYNGEIYNFRELRDELRLAGCSFRSDTDTEVVIQAYLRWGIDAIGRFEGMFAFALCDLAQGRTYLVRDRLGIKPCFYSLAGGRLTFASEMRAILADPRVPRDIDPGAAWEFFSYGYVPTPGTIYRDLHKLPPATVLEHTREGRRTWRYWTPAMESCDDGPAAAGARLRELLDRSVEAYLVSDVPTGSYLSGGLDSTLVSGSAASVFASPNSASRRLGCERFHTFSIGFDVEEHSELPYARIAAGRFDTEHVELVVTREMAHARSEQVLDLFDEPFAASSSIPMLFVAELARKDVTVALCGEGGDETFGGYSWYKWWQRFRRPSFWATPRGQVARRVLEALLRRPRRKWRLPALEDVDLYAQLMGAMVAADKRKIFSPELAAQLASRDDAAYFRQHWRTDLPPMARMQYVDLMTFLPDLNLARADRTSMHASLELRVPLLNHHLVEYLCGLREEVRNPGGELKGLLKRTMGDRLPEEIRNRPKKGFSAPVKQWFTREDLASLVDAVFAEHPDLARSWLHPNLRRHAAAFEGSRAYKLWVFLRWLRKYAR